MIATLGVFHRLRGPIDVVADIFRRRAFDVRHLAFQPLPALVEPPRQRRRPTKTGLDHNHLEFLVPLQHALEHDAGERSLLALRMADHLLDVEARPARCRDRIAAEAKGMHADRKPGLLRGLINRPVAALAERLDVAAEQQHLDEIPVAGAFADFFGRRQAVLVADHDRALEARILAGPFLDLPVVDRGAERGAELMIADALSAGERIENAQHDIVRIEMLLLHERQRRTLGTAFRRIGVPSRRVRLAPSDRAGLPSCPDTDVCRRSRDVRASASPDMGTTRFWSHAPDGYRNRQSPFSRQRTTPVRHCRGTARSWRGLLSESNPASLN